ncbi:hypothetical protein DM02DRAFT_624487 [Periconia macrospinosa]|uniref:Uncharacterized protein n=1 Tax=Periconia macrospinosa TaxID=97972 RepID=A0A2V1E6N5_9PLEO|nr:hypothetical protein DM02DRAFT_624487 [Periconia macrospinosa]
MYGYYSSTADNGNIDATTSGTLGVVPPTKSSTTTTYYTSRTVTYIHTPVHLSIAPSSRPRSQSLGAAAAAAAAASDRVLRTHEPLSRAAPISAPKPPSTPMSASLSVASHRAMDTRFLSSFADSSSLHPDTRSCLTAATPDENPDHHHPTTGIPRPLFASPPPSTRDDPSLPQPLPSPLPTSESLDLPTPLLETGPDLSLSFAGTVLPSNHVSIPAPPVLKNSPNLRLPSFDLLGIAAPHPDRKSFDTSLSFASLGAGPLSKPEDPLHALSPPLARIIPPLDEPHASPAATSKPARGDVHHPVPVVTPPAESGTLNWGSFVNVRPAGLGSPPSSEPGLSPNLTNTASANSLGPASNVIVPIMQETDGDLGMAACIDRIKEILATESRAESLGLVKILSHALPCPSMSGHLFGQLIVFIHDRTTSYTSWTNVFHAVPGRFTLSDLPKSPPSTPGPAVGGDEYFTKQIFDSAVAIPDYQLESKLLPPSPRPVVPPGSINISIVERYIPPTNTNEYAEMFQLRGRSLLHDRLIELSKDNGLLLFIYPTKTGARTFMQDYLGPVLDPLLRALTVVHDLPSDLGKSLGQMGSVAYLDEYESLKMNVEQFCKRVGNATSTDSVDQRPVYEVMHASREEIHPERKAWANDWWIKQEKPRIRDTITTYFRQTKKLPESGMTGSHLIEAVLDGVAHRNADGDHRLKGIEVGVFIIKKRT